jgi:hypothetical protein
LNSAAQSLSTSSPEHHSSLKLQRSIPFLYLSSVRG